MRTVCANSLGGHALTRVRSSRTMSMKRASVCSKSETSSLARADACDIVVRALVRRQARGHQFEIASRGLVRPSSQAHDHTPRQTRWPALTNMTSTSKISCVASSRTQARSSHTSSTTMRAFKFEVRALVRWKDVHSSLTCSNDFDEHARICI